MKSANEKVLIIGAGNEFRSDDAAGLLAARLLAAKLGEKETAGAMPIPCNEATPSIVRAEVRADLRICHRPGAHTPVRPCADLPGLRGNGVRVLELSGDATRLLEVWPGAEKVVVIDAVSSGAAPGMVHRVNSGQLEELDHLSALSTHGIGLAHAVRMAVALGELPPELVIYGIEGQSFDHGLGVSPEVARAVEQVAQSILEEVGCTNTVLPGT